METQVEHRDACLGLAVLRRTQNAAVPAGLDSRGAGEMQLSSSSSAPPTSAPNSPVTTHYVLKSHWSL